MHLLPFADNPTLAGIGQTLIARNQSIAVAESVTAGLMQYGFSTIKDSSSFFQGGITVYNVGQKVKHLHVEPIHAIKVNCVSGQVVTQMAVNVCQMFCSTWGIASAGYASPVPESGMQIFAFYAIVKEGRMIFTDRITLPEGDPSDYQPAYALQIIEKFNLVLLNDRN